MAESKNLLSLLFPENLFETDTPLRVKCLPHFSEMIFLWFI